MQSWDALRASATAVANYSNWGQTMATVLCSPFPDMNSSVSRSKPHSLHWGEVSHWLVMGNKDQSSSPFPILFLTKPSLQPGLCSPESSPSYSSPPGRRHLHSQGAVVSFVFFFQDFLICSLLYNVAYFTKSGCLSTTQRNLPIIYPL